MEHSGSTFNPLMMLMALLTALTTVVTPTPAAATGTTGGGAAAAAAAGGLRVDYYQSTCRNAASIVAAGVAMALKNNPGIAAPLLRLHFHDCFVQGCDASVLLDSKRGSGTKAEKDADSNFSLAAFEVVDSIKRQLEAACPGVVSCADVLALAARESVRLAGGPWIPTRLGRRDGRSSLAVNADSSLPAATLNTSGLIANFGRVGLNLVDIVALSGAHTIGGGHCKSVQNRLAPNVDPTMSPELRYGLSMACRGPSVKPVPDFPNDLRTPLTFDNQYYKNILANLGAFTSDQKLLYDDSSKPYVHLYAQNQVAFFNQFKLSMLKMSEILPLTGNQGEIRRSCRVVNGDT